VTGVVVAADRRGRRGGEASGRSRTVYVSGVTDYQYMGPLVSVIRHVQAFDVAGVQGCTGVPAQCAPRWDLSPPRDVLAYSDPVITDGVLYVVDLDVEAQPSATLARVVRAYRL